jgi:hypothetical protein
MTWWVCNRANSFVLSLGYLTKVWIPTSHCYKLHLFLPFRLVGEEGDEIFHFMKFCRGTKVAHNVIFFYHLQGNFGAAAKLYAIENSSIQILQRLWGRNGRRVAVKDTAVLATWPIVSWSSHVECSPRWLSLHRFNALPAPPPHPSRNRIKP